jgi:hypothetical protein
MADVAQTFEYSEREAEAWSPRRRRRTARAIATAKSLLPLSVGRFSRLLSEALDEAPSTGEHFCLGDFAARRALGERLVIEIDPALLQNRLKHRSARTGRSIYLQDKFLGAGEWRALLEPLSESSTHREVGQIVESNFDYRRTKAYGVAMERAGGANPVERNFVALKTPELVETYYRLTAKLCRSIHDKGVLRRADCRIAANLFRHPRVRLPWVELMEADIGIAIGPDGEFYRFASGKHRTAAAQFLGLMSVPVEVRMVHEKWLRRQVAETGLHPVEALIRGVHRFATREAAQACMAHDTWLTSPC